MKKMFKIEGYVDTDPRAMSDDIARLFAQPWILEANISVTDYQKQMAHDATTTEEKHGL
jgi:hypothetical protein